MADTRQVTPSSSQRHLIVGPSWVGDMVMAQTLFSQLKQNQADCRIDVLAPDWSRPILERMPEVNAALSLPFGHGELKLVERRRQGKALAGQYDQAIVLPNSLKSALLPWWAEVPLRTGWRGEMRHGLLNDIRRLDKQRYPLMVQRFVALGLPADADVPAQEAIVPPHLQADQTAAEAAMQRLQLTLDRPVLGLCPGAEFGPSKRWPERHYAAVARYWLRQGWQIWLFGSANDQPVANAIRELLTAEEQQQTRVLAGETSLADAVDLMAQASAFVSNDSGLMHIAAALQKPLVAVYGSTSPAFTPPLSANARCVRLGLSCSPCFERECPLGHTNCLQQLPPGRVNRELDALLQAEGA